MTNLNNQKAKSDRLVKMAMMAAVACVIGLVRFPLIPAVSFLTYDLADIPIIITTFAFGPAAGMLALTVVSAIQAFLLGGDSVYGFPDAYDCIGCISYHSRMHLQKTQDEESRNYFDGGCNSCNDGCHGLRKLFCNTVLLRRRSNERGRCKPDAADSFVQRNQGHLKFAYHFCGI